MLKKLGIITIDINKLYREEYTEQTAADIQNRSLSNFRTDHLAGNEDKRLVIVYLFKNSKACI